MIRRKVLLVILGNDQEATLSPGKGKTLSTLFGSTGRRSLWVSVAALVALLLCGFALLATFSVESLDGMARFLAGLFCPFVLRKPVELREALKQHASEIARLAELRESEAPS